MNHASSDSDPPYRTPSPLDRSQPGRFTDPLGEPVKPDSFSQMFDRHQRGLAAPRIRLHDLRHTSATLMLASGANPKTVSERLGHASTAFTMDVYAASVPALEEETAAKVAKLLE